MPRIRAGEVLLKDYAAAQAIFVDLDCFWVTGYSFSRGCGHDQECRLEMIQVFVLLIECDLFGAVDSFDGCEALSELKLMTLGLK